MMKRASSNICCGLGGVAVAAGGKGGGLNSTPSLLQCQSAAATPTVATSRRGYYYWFAEDFVPEGSKTSRFQSSNTPSIRKKIIQEYAMSPLYGARNNSTAVMLVSSKLTKGEFYKHKPALRKALEDVLGLSEGRIELGPTEELMYEFGRQVAKGVTFFDKNGESAKVAVDVVLPEEMDEEEVHRVGKFLCQIVNRNSSAHPQVIAGAWGSQYFPTTTAGFDSSNNIRTITSTAAAAAAAAAGEEKKKAVVEEEEVDLDNYESMITKNTLDETTSSSGTHNSTSSLPVDEVFASNVDLEAATAIFEKLGISGAHLPQRARKGTGGSLDADDSVFDHMFGEDITLEEGIAATERWVQRDIANEEYLQSAADTAAAMEKQQRQKRKEDN